MEIQPATEADLDALLGLMRGYCDFYGAAPADEGLTAMARALIAAPDDEGMLLVARDRDAAVGFAAVGWKWSSLRAARVAIMEDLFVDPAARGHGAGARLIEACAERAAALGAPVLIWQTAHDNERARSVYERAGAEASSWLEYALELPPSRRRP